MSNYERDVDEFERLVKAMLEDGMGSWELKRIIDDAIEELSSDLPPAAIDSEAKSDVVAARNTRK